jgi:hypothetical protein
MGLLSKLTGGTDTKLLANGRPARGVIVDVALTGSTVQMGGGFVERICVFTVEVTLDGQPPYHAQIRQRIPEIQIPQIQPGNTMVMVKVDPSDPTKAAIDWSTPAPKVTMTNTGRMTAADIIASGLACEAVIIESRPLGMQNPSGIDMYAFALSVFVPGRAPYQIQVGNPVPPPALPLLFPGSRLPAKVDPDEPNGLAIDWETALSAFQ